MRKEEKQKKEKKECGTLTNVIKREMIITAFAKRLVSWLNSYECYKSEEKVLQKGDKYCYTVALFGNSLSICPQLRNFLSPPISFLRSFHYLVTLNLYADRLENHVTNNN